MSDIETGKKTLSVDQRKEISKAVLEGLEQDGLRLLAEDGNGFGGVTDIIGRSEEQAYHLEWRVGETGDIHMAATLPTTIKTSADYLNAVKEYDVVDKEREDLIKLSRKAVASEGIIGTALEALVELPSLGGWFIDEPDEELRKILWWWAENVNAINGNDLSDTIDPSMPVNSLWGIEFISLMILMGMYVDGDTVLTESWESVPVPVAGGKNFDLPVHFMSHDPLSLDIDETLAKMGKETIWTELDEEFKKILKEGDKGDPNKQAVLDNAPKSLIDSVNSEEFDGKYQLPSMLTSHFSRKTHNRTAWSLPFCIRAFPALAFKHRLRALDIATIDGLVQRIWLVKIGHDDYRSKMHIPTPDRVSLAVSQLKKLKTQNFMVWSGPDIATEELGSSDENILSFADRYKEANDDIRRALGVPAILTSEGAAGHGDSDVNQYKKVVAQMERYHLQIKRWIDKKLYQIAQENGFKDANPQFNWMFLQTKDRDSARNIVTKLYENGAIGLRWFHYLLGLNPDRVIPSMIQEEKEKLNDQLPLPRLPNMSKDPGRPADTKDGDGDSYKNKPTKTNNDKKKKKKNKDE